MKDILTQYSSQQVDVLTEQIFNDLIDNFLESEIIGCNKVLCH